MDEYWATFHAWCGSEKEFQALIRAYHAESTGSIDDSHCRQLMMCGPLGLVDFKANPSHPQGAVFIPVGDTARRGLHHPSDSWQNSKSAKGGTAPATSSNSREVSEMVAARCWCSWLSSAFGRWKGQDRWR